MAHYLMRLVEGFGEQENYTYHLIEADSEQMVKYHYHDTLKNWGYRAASWGDKHSLDTWDAGWAELDKISELNHIEQEVLSDHLQNWHKTTDV